MPLPLITIPAHPSLLGPCAMPPRIKGKFSLGSLHYERFKEMVSEVPELRDCNAKILWVHLRCQEF